jgi:hypothetical protein
MDPPIICCLLLGLFRLLLGSRRERRIAATLCITPCCNTISLYPGHRKEDSGVGSLSVRKRRSSASNGARGVTLGRKHFGTSALLFFCAAGLFSHALAHH